MYDLISEFVNTRLRAFASKSVYHFRALLVIRTILWPLNVTLIPLLFIVIQALVAIVHGFCAMAHRACLHVAAGALLAYEYASKVTVRIWNQFRRPEVWSAAHWESLYRREAPTPLPPTPITDDDEDPHHSDMSGYVDQDAE